MPEKPDINERLFARKSFLAQAVDRNKDDIMGLWDCLHRLENRVATAECNIEDNSDFHDQRSEDQWENEERLTKLEEQIPLDGIWEMELQADWRAHKADIHENWRAHKADVHEKIHRIYTRLAELEELVKAIMNREMWK